ncbi:hypothetical protein DSO57_1027458 [Entomophthora muscae]|uniref:Uncharacterized protein n=1 Tax=Entomophthora muscae TaxID=34485 RepID=A0ACC2RSP1_9FUNG|nr:hypothetical protein DSO57_1027458 [Entomophthora muscae]
MFFDFWNINSINSYIWLPLVLNLLLCSVIIFLLVSIKNDIQDANRWYIITCACSVIFLLFYLLFVTQIILITSKNGYVFPPASPFRDSWDQDQLWYESHFQAPSKFPYAFWMGATIEALAGVPTGQMIVSISLVIISLLVRFFITRVLNDFRLSELDSLSFFPG